MIVAVGSENPVKVKAVKEVMSEIYGNVEIVSYSVDSGVSKQPTSLEEIVKGAINRARNVLLKNDNAQFGRGDTQSNNFYFEFKNKRSVYALVVEPLPSRQKA